MTEKRVYILLTDTGTVFTKLIKLYTKKPYNHASISFDSELSEVYSFGRKTARNPFIGGFVKEDIRKGLFKQADCAIYSFTVSEVQMQKINRYIKEIEAQKENYRYNFLGLFGFLLNKPIKRKKAFFCSQFVASVLKECHIIDFEKSPSLIAPNDLQKRTEFQFVYEGKLKAYHNKRNGKKVHMPVHFIPIKM
ncbi:hypothetical protein U5N28_16690 [Lysinibacillus telephonicus]|uniref:Uncharacterized protein n=1 Tax=Lysinibacillus telephonicus TaxID=1714840 RepID=A0A431UMZ4_9BACI|nr:hypothetical protein [Lysinibacillus telephonicus]RTQ90830.1 hypothetical protein EKG35_14250 [Lysinibacillus telephonicus]